MATLKTLLVSIDNTNKDNIAEIIRQLVMIVRAEKGNEFAASFRKHGTAVLKVAGTVEFKPAYKHFLEVVDDLLFDVLEEAKERVATLRQVNGVLLSCVEGAGINGYAFGPGVTCADSTTKAESMVH